jgi:hypothetical protein
MLPPAAVSTVRAVAKQLCCTVLGLEGGQSDTQQLWGTMSAQLQQCMQCVLCYHGAQVRAWWC